MLLNRYTEETIKEDMNIQNFGENSRERYGNYKRKIYTFWKKPYTRKTNSEVDI